MKLNMKTIIKDLNWELRPYKPSQNNLMRLQNFHMMSSLTLHLDREFQNYWDTRIYWIWIDFVLNGFIFQMFCLDKIFKFIEF